MIFDEKSYFCISNNNKHLLNMEKNSIKSLKVICRVALTLCVLYCIAIIIQSPKYFHENPGGEFIRWHGENAWIKGTIVIGYVATASIAVLLSALFFLNILRGIKEGNIFPKRNISILHGLTLVTFMLSFFSSNLSVALSAEEHGTIVVTDINILLPLAVFTFTQMYKIAHVAMEDSRLAI